MSPDPWESAISALATRSEPGADWPSQQTRVVRLADDETPDAEREAKIEAVFRALPDELSEADRRILYALAHGGPSSKRGLARALEMDRAYLARRLHKLVAAKLVAYNGADWSLG